ncbi:MAG: hydroxyacylglutathione hydrolase C-terminal domain-containing protein, partial [Pseudomonadota bacterium]
ALYGGRIDSNHDMLILKTYLKMFFTTSVFDGSQSLKSGISVVQDATSVDQHLKEFEKLCHKRRELGHATVPTTIGLEKKLNPFLRVTEKRVKEAAGLPNGEEVEVFAEIRRRKDHF